MVFNEYQTQQKALAPHIHSYNVLEIEGDECSPWERCLPDGYVKLYFLNGAIPFYKDDQGNPLHWKDGVGGHPIGDKQCFIKLPNQKTRVIWASLKPYFFNWISKVPINLINNNVVPFVDIFTKNDLIIENQIAEQTENRAIVKLLDAFFMKKFLNCSGHDLKMINIQNEIYSHHGTLNFELIANQNNLSMRTLQRNFIEQIGMSPKHYARVIRFSHVMKLRREQPEYDWQDIISLCSYHDQSHFIHDVKSITGTSPTIFFNDTNLIKNLHVGR